MHCEMDGSVSIYSFFQSGNLIASLMVQEAQVPFTTLEQLANQDEYSLGVMQSTAWSDLFKVTFR